MGRPIANLSSYAAPFGRSESARSGGVIHEPDFGSNGFFAPFTTYSSPAITVSRTRSARWRCSNCVGPATRLWA